MAAEFEQLKQQRVAYDTARAPAEVVLLARALGVAAAVRLTRQIVRQVGGVPSPPTRRRATSHGGGVPHRGLKRRPGAHPSAAHPSWRRQAPAVAMSGILRRPSCNCSPTACSAATR